MATAIGRITVQLVLRSTISGQLLSSLSDLRRFEVQVESVCKFLLLHSFERLASKGVYKEPMRI